MSSRRKREKNILREFRHLSESDLMMEIHAELTKFMILTKSEEEATKILEKYNKKACFDFNVWKKVKYFKLMTCARLMNLVIPSEWYNIEIAEDDIVERIIEFRNDEIKWINENSYLYDCSSRECETFDNEEEFISFPSDIKIDEIIAFYDNIVNKEFGNRKKLVK